VNVIGYPLGIGAAGNWPIWITGHLASDPDFDFDRRPVILIDARTREGMSGSPVILRTKEVYAQGIGRLSIQGPSQAEMFLGVYAGRLRADLDLGYVWRARVVREILQGRSEPNPPRARINDHIQGDAEPLRSVDDPYDEADPHSW
jgi:hypothetical protein